MLITLSVLFSRQIDRLGLPIVLLFLVLGTLGDSEGWAAHRRTRARLMRFPALAMFTQRIESIATVASTRPPGKSRRGAGRRATCG